jgi:hypothetical protein
VRLDKHAADRIAGGRTAGLARDEQFAAVLAEFGFNGRKQRCLAAAFDAFE